MVLYLFLARKLLLVHFEDNETFLDFFKTLWKDPRGEN